MRLAGIIHFMIVLTVLGFSNSIMAQDKSNRGKEFWLGYGHNVLFTQDPPYNSQNLVLYLSVEEAATVTVSVNGTGWTQTLNIPANSVDYSIIIPKSGTDDARLLNEGLSTKGIHIVSNVPIVAYAHQYGLLSSGATMLMPVETFGYTYYSLNYNQVSNYVDSYSWFFVVAAEDNTRIEITPSDTTEGGWLKGQTYTVNLKKGEIYNVFGKKTGTSTSKDMTGSKVVSIAGSDGLCHPVGLFSGMSRNVICANNGGEFMQQQIFPANAWGTKYVTYHTMISTSGNIAAPFLNLYRIAVRNPSTIVKVNGAPLPLTDLKNNFYYEISSYTGDIIESDQPILVAQYTLSSNECTGTNANPTGDPEMIYLSPIEQGVKRTIFYNTRNQAITMNFVNVIVPTTGLNSLLIDGSPVSASEYIIHPNSSNYAVVVRRLMGAATQHSIVCDSTFIATNYGTGIFESYGYNVGTLVNNLNAFGSIRNVYNNTGTIDSFTCIKTPVRFYIQLAYQASSITWKLSQLTGISPNTDSVINNPVPVDTKLINGRRYYTYTLQQDFVFNSAGTYYVPVSYSAADIDNCNHTESASIKVVVKPGLQPDFSLSNPACLADNISFSGTVNGNGFSGLNYTWSFPDNSTSNGISATHRFGIAGDQIVKFAVTTSNGCTGDTSKVINVSHKPVAKFGVAGPFCENRSILFTDSSSAGQGAIASWEWQFDNNQQSVKPPVSKTFTTGNHVISLIIKNESGCSSMPFTQTLTVHANPVLNAGPDKTISPGDTTQLYATLTNSGQYEISWTPASSLSDPNMLQPNSWPLSTTTYTIHAYEKTNFCEGSDEVIVSVFTKLFVPSAFTPNGDGKNDTWEIPALAMYPEAVLQVFNRSGQVIFQSKGLYTKGWNGKYHGMPQSNDVYVYIIHLKPESKEIVKGTVTIIK